jgi:hypothetical protein
MSQIVTGKGPTNQQTVWAVRGLAAVATVVLLSFITPLVWAAVSAGAGLVALATLGVLGFVAIQSIPLGMQRLENHLLRMRKKEAGTNPIEQLQNDCLRREERLNAFRSALVTIGGQIESLGQMLEERRQSDPAQILDRQSRALERMEQFYHVNLDRLDEAHAALEAFRDQVKQKMFEWEFAQAGQVVMNSLNPSEMEDLMQGLLTDEALSSVQTRFNRVFAELDVEMRSIDAPTHALLKATRLQPVSELGASNDLKVWSKP